MDSRRRCSESLIHDTSVGRAVVALAAASILYGLTDVAVAFCSLLDGAIGAAVAGIPDSDMNAASNAMNPFLATRTWQPLHPDVVVALPYGRVTVHPA